MEGLRAVVLPADKEMSTGELVQRIAGRAESGPALLARALAIAPVIHPPPTPEAALQDWLTQLTAGQEALLRAVGGLARR